MPITPVVITQLSEALKASYAAGEAAAAAPGATKEQIQNAVAQAQAAAFVAAMLQLTPIVGGVAGVNT